MSWIITGEQKYPAVIGEPFGGGYFAGYISHTADGNPTHALIVAPRATGATGTGYTLTTNLAWKTTLTATPDANSDYDGAANTAKMVEAGINDHPAAKFCVDLSIDGFTDWYLPSRYELDIAYFYLKPSVTTNNTGYGINNYSVPIRVSNYTESYPPQTYLSLFNTSTQGFVADSHWTSTQQSSSLGWFLDMNRGNQSILAKTTARPVRAFRRIAL